MLALSSLFEVHGFTVYFIMTNSDLRKGQDLLAKQSISPPCYLHQHIFSLSHNRSCLCYWAAPSLVAVAASDATRYGGQGKHPSYLFCYCHMRQFGVQGEYFCSFPKMASPVFLQIAMT